MCVSWNALPYVLRAKTCLTKFLKNLKATYFKLCFAKCVNSVSFIIIDFFLVAVT